jgi:hypothetical protein
MGANSYRYAQAVESAEYQIRHCASSHPVDCTLETCNLARAFLGERDSQHGPKVDSYRAQLADKIEQTISGTQFEVMVSDEDWRVILEALRDGPNSEQNAVPQAESGALERLYKAVQPFVWLMKGTSGRIPTERLSFANWHELAKAYDEATPPHERRDATSRGETK